MAPTPKPQTPTVPGGTNGMKSNLGFSPPHLSLVTLIVNNQKFVVHKDLVIHHSPFFKAAFESKFVEGQTQTMQIRDVEPSIFEMFVCWLYNKEIQHKNDNPATPVPHSNSGSTSTSIPMTSVADTDDHSDQCVRIAKLWTMAELFRVPVLQNDAMATLIPLMQLNRILDPYIIYAYGTYTGDTPLKRVVIMRVLQFLNDGFSYRAWVTTPWACREFANDLALKLAEEYLKLSEGKSCKFGLVDDYMVKVAVKKE